MHVPGKLGRLAAQRPVGLKTLAHYLTLPKAPAALGYIQKFYQPRIATWPCLGNDQAGDCTLAAIVHVFQAVAAVLGLPATASMSEQEVLSLYYQMTGGADSGLVEANVLSYGRTNGFGGQKLWGFAPLQLQSMEALKTTIMLFGAVYVGINVPANYMDDFSQGVPWDKSNARSVGGHAIPFVDYDEEFLEAITWGAYQRMTWDAWQQQGEEAWAVLPQAYIDSGRSALDGLDVTTMESDLAALTAA